MLWVVDDFLSDAECVSWRERLDGEEFLDATVNSQGGRVVDSTIRDNSVAVLRDPTIAEALFTRLRPHLPQSMTFEHPEEARRRRATPFGLKSPMRVYRYRDGQHFGLHHDQSYEGPDGSRSWLTFLVYLNDGFRGGETSFPDVKRVVEPVGGRALIFQHAVMHEGRPVTEGTKLVLRSDVLFQWT